MYTSSLPPPPPLADMRGKAPARVSAPLSYACSLCRRRRPRLLRACSGCGYYRQPEGNYLPRFSPPLISLER